MKRVKFFQIAATCIASAALYAQAQAVAVVEYRNKTLDAYFITGRVNEQALLDTLPDFARTGMSFQAVAATAANDALTKICRFYVNVANPFVNSHFYGRQGSDCELILGLNLTGFNYEGYDFAVQPPVTTACPMGTVPVYRSFRALNALANSVTSNHRYTVSTATYANAAAAGYVAEGVQFCVTLATDVVNPIISIAPSWAGTATTSSPVISISAQVLWALESTVNNIASYRSGGTANVLQYLGGVCSLNPSSGIIKATGILIVDYNVNPPTYRGGGDTTWPATLSCPPNPATPSTVVTALYFAGSKGAFATEAQGSVSAGGTTIEGSDTVPGQVTSTWKFTRN